MIIRVDPESWNQSKLVQLDSDALDNMTAVRKMEDWAAEHPTPAAELATTALDLVRAHSISPVDSWYVACAIHAQAELWLSHAHDDGLAEKAQAAGAEVHLLTAEQFR